MALDPITLELIWTRLISVVDEASRALQRSSFSLIVREGNDFVVVLLDRLGNNIAQSTKTIPAFTLAASAAVKECLKKIPAETLNPDDIIISNNPWISTGHSFDVLVFQPIFNNGFLVGFAATITHWGDIGGRGWTLDFADYYEEGLVIPIVKLMESGERNEIVFDFIRENVRNPENALGDLAAQLSATSLLSSNVPRILLEFERTDLDEISAQIRERCENAMRASIAKLDDGRYQNVLRVDGIDGTLELSVAIVVDGDRIKVDFDGTSPQSKYAINSVLGFSAGYALYALKSILCPHIPNNSGANAPIEITAPKGCILNPIPPAPLVSRHVVGHLSTEAIIGALARMLPESTPAGSPTSWILNFDVLPVGENKSATFQLFLNGGLGAFSFQDGRICCLYPAAVQNTPIEILEKEFPVRFETKEYRPGSGGKGTFRGGAGQIVQIRILSPVRFTSLTSFIENSPKGIQGGMDGKPGLMFVDGKELPPRRTVELRTGELLSLFLPGGGGYGDPTYRADALVHLDRANELAQVGAIELNFNTTNAAKAAEDRR